MKYSQVIITEVDLKKLLKKQNLSISQVEKLTGLKRQTIYNAINGKCIMTEESWLKIKNILDKYEKTFNL